MTDNQQATSKLQAEIDEFNLWSDNCQNNLSRYFESVRNKVNLAFSKHNILILNVKNEQNKQKLEKSYAKICKHIASFEFECLTQVTSSKLEKIHQTYKETTYRIERMKNEIKTDSRSIIDMVSNETHEIKRSLFNNKTIAFLDSTQIEFDTEKSVGKLIIINGYYLNEKIIQKLSKEISLISGELTREIIILKAVELLANNEKIVDELEYDAINKIISLNLKSEEITSIKLNAFSSFKNLESLDLSNNKLTSLDPRTFNDLEHLVKLYLNDNLIEYVDSATFYCLVRLEILDLSNNNLTRIEKDTFFRLDSLKELNLKGNKKVLIDHEKYFVDIPANCRIEYDRDWLDNLADAFSFNCSFQ